MRLLNRKSPHSTVLPAPSEDQEVEYRHDGDRVLGLAAAHLMDTLAVSLPTARPWEASWLSVEYVLVDEDEVQEDSDSRINLGLCNFTDIDGDKRLFSLHTRFRPRPGRIHLRVVAEEGRVRIGYIGRKRLAEDVPRNSR
ncbi:hypothetical protein ACF1BP_00685 [Streptomyces sp. NPDC014735]|uniref:hypothetical protein n=1 Tax=unclassified Streptomyces TaxID=2593676 RepID=UPI0036F4DCE9